MVSPIAGHFGIHQSISPALEYENCHPQQQYVSRMRSVAVPSRNLHDDFRLHLSAANAQQLRCMILSSTEAVLEAKFAQGYDNAALFLKRHNLETTTAAHPSSDVASLWSSSSLEQKEPPEERPVS